MAREKLSTGLRDLLFVASFCATCEAPQNQAGIDMEYWRHIAMDESSSRIKIGWPPAWKRLQITLKEGLDHVRTLRPFVSSTPYACKRCGQLSPIGVSQRSYEELAYDTKRLWQELSLSCIRENCMVFEENSLRCSKR